MGPETYSIGEQVIVSSGARAYKFDRIARETSTRWVCESGKWFDKATGYGPRPAGKFTLRDELRKADDPAGLRSILMENVRSAASRADRMARAQNVDLDQLLSAAELLENAVRQFRAFVAGAAPKNE